MKNALLGLVLTLLSINSFATGGFYCVSSELDNQVEIWGTTGRVPGNPIVGDVGVNVTNGPQLMYTRGQVVAYWNMGETFKLALIDQNAEKLEYVIEAKFYETEEAPIAKGVLKLASGELSAVTCELE